jgi:UMF1 family MFS transporter
MSERRFREKLAIFSWALYDFANTFFAMNVISLYFALWVTVDKGGKDILYSLTISSSILLMILVLPTLGIASDRMNKRMPFLIHSTLLCIIFTAFLGIIENLILGLILFILANFFYQLAIVFYNALLVQISKTSEIGRISGYGVSLSYLGTICALILVRPFVLRSGHQAAFFPTALYFFLFSLPCFLFVREEKQESTKIEFLKIIKGIKGTIKDLKKIDHLFNFLVASFLSLNAINTVLIFMSVYAKKVIKFSDMEINNFFILSSIFAICGSVVSGFISDRIGPKRAMSLVLLFWSITLSIAVLSFKKQVFWITGLLGGLSLGSSWVVSRALAIKIIPKSRLAEFFGIYGVTGKFSSIFGPIIWGLIILLLEPLGLLRYRLAIISLLCFIILGYLFLRKIPDSI